MKEVISTVRYTCDICVDECTYLDRIVRNATKNKLLDIYSEDRFLQYNTNAIDGDICEGCLLEYLQEFINRRLRKE